MTENNSKITKALLSDFVNQGFCEPQVQEIALGLEEKLPINVYAKQCYNWMQMREIRLGLAEQLDINYYANPLFSANQMREIRIGLKLCVDVSQYANLMFSVTDMRQTRHKLMKEAYKKDNSRFDGVIFDEESQINIRLSDNSMNAYITIPAMTSTGYTVFDLIKLLKKYDIVYGVIEENLRNAVGNNICNQEIKVAEGKRSQIGKSGRYELFFQNDLPNEPLALPDGRVDYSNIIVAETVEEGQILAQYYKKQPGKRGMTVTGISVNGKYGRELSGLTGNNIVVEKDADIYRAATRGYVSFDSLHYELNV
ncbi:MAG: FapA family protein, partial [Clostridiales bacterium]|nr:FapA family protein [Clostridiales bacterium]